MARDAEVGVGSEDVAPDVPISSVRKRPPPRCGHCGERGHTALSHRSKPRGIAGVRDHLRATVDGGARPITINRTHGIGKPGVLERQAAETYPSGVRRPIKRGDCSPCPVCQARTDGTSPSTKGPGEILACGHAPQDAFLHSRPCAFVSCSQHLYLDVTSFGSLKLNHPHLDPWEIPESCALDVADRGGVTLETVGRASNLTRERVRQIEERATRRLRGIVESRGMRPSDVHLFVTKRES